MPKTFKQTEFAVEPSTVALPKSQSQTQRAVAMLRDMVLSNKLLPGSNHLEIELAEMLGTSRTPIREAALVLEGQGLIEVKPRRGIRILPISAGDMEEIYAILTELESLAAYDVAKISPKAAELKHLRAAIDDMRKALKTDDRMRWAEADDRFHRELVRLAGNKRLESIVLTYSDQVQRAKLVTLYIRPSPVKSLDDHSALLQAIEEGDAEKARRLHREHRMDAKNIMIDLLKRHGLSAL